MVFLASKVISRLCQTIAQMQLITSNHCTSLKKVDRFEGVKLKQVYTFPKRVYIHLRLGCRFFETDAYLPGRPDKVTRQR